MTRSVRRGAVAAASATVMALAALGPLLVAVRASEPSETPSPPVAVPTPAAASPPVVAPTPPVDPTPKPDPETPPPVETPEPDKPDPTPVPATEPPHPTPPHPTPSLEPSPLARATPVPKPKPKPKPTPEQEGPGNQVPGEHNPGGHGPGGQASGAPSPVRQDEPPAAPGTPSAVSPGGQPPGDGRPSASTGEGGAGPDGSADPSAPFPFGSWPAPERVQLAVAGATASGIAAALAWLILGARRRLPASAGDSAAPGQASVTPAPPTDVDVESILKGSGTARDRRNTTAPPRVAPSLWQAEDERPRWVRRLDDQKPERPKPKRRPPPAADAEAMPWRDALDWNDATTLDVTDPTGRSGKPPR